MQSRKLYRSQVNKVIAGVCGGFAEYFEVDPVIIRIIFVLLTIFGGSGIILYIAAIFLVPKKPLTTTGSESGQGTNESFNLRKIFGIGVICIGALILMGNLGVFSFFHVWDISWSFIFPIVLIILGMAMIYYRQSDVLPGESVQSEAPPGDSTQPQSPHYRSFRRSSTDRKLLGVCGGLAQYFSLDSSIVRILYVILCLASFGAGIILYITLALLAPDDRYVNSQSK